MSKIQDFAVYCTTAQKTTFSAMDGNARLNVVNAFYQGKGLEKPVSITVSTSKKGNYLTKDEKIMIQTSYINAMQSGNVTPELENNLQAVFNPENVATFSETLIYSDAVKNFGPAVVASKMIDALSVSDNEEFHKIRKFDVPASVAISEIPAFIKALQKIYDESTKESK